jgi:hypothetical protein
MKSLFARVPEKLFSPAACPNQSRSLPPGKKAIPKSPMPSRPRLNEDATDAVVRSKGLTNSA